MSRHTSSSNLLTKVAAHDTSTLHADLCEKLWLLSDKNDLIRDLAKDSSIDEVEVMVAEFEKMAKLSPRERLIARLNSEHSRGIVLD